MKDITITKHESILLWIILLLIFLALGSTLNWRVLEKNDCKMPILNGWSDEDHINFNHNNKPELWYLSDIITTGKNRKSAIGDVIMSLSYTGIIIFSIKFIHSKYKDGSKK